MKWVADFETTTKKRFDHDGQCYVWGCGMCEVGNPDNRHYMTTIEEFLEFCEKQKTNDKVWFHNLKFDGSFIVTHLLKQGYKHVTDSRDKVSRTFTTLISEQGMWYQIEIFFKVRGSKVNKVTIMDSLKLIPLAVKQIAKSFKLEIRKGSIDYAAHDFLPYGSPMTDEELGYLENDILIVEHALSFFHNQGLDKMTIGSCALDEFKRLINRKFFKQYFPPAYYYEEVKHSYRGGFTYLNPKFAGKVVKDLMVYDVNSLYPSVMAGAEGEMLPYGAPIEYDGEYKEDEFYPLYIQKLQCAFDLKPGKIPTIQLKHTAGYRENEYITTTEDRIETLTLTSVDLKLFMEQYEVTNLKYLNGWKFKGVHGSVIFGDYVEKWSRVKIQSKEEGNHGMYLISKLFLNNLYGKFGQAIELVCKVPFIGKDGVLHFHDGEPEKRDGVYIAMACFITAWARNKTIRAAQKIQDDYHAGRSKIQFIYADTDSLHVTSPGFIRPEGLRIHSTDLGAWDEEALARKGKFLRQKCYIEEHIINEKAYTKGMSDEDETPELYIKEGENFYKMKVTVAGMPESCHKDVTFKNFKLGATYGGKLKHRTVNGGVILEDIDFTIKKS